MFWDDGDKKYIVSRKELKRMNVNKNWIKKYIPIKQNDAIVLLSGCEPNKDNFGITLDKCISFLKEKNISKIIFYLDDVFRTSLSPLHHVGFNCEERIINKIINQVNIKEYDVYHCEKIKNNYTGVSLFDDTKYMDFFLINQSKKQDYQVVEQPNTLYNKKISCLNNRYEHHRFIITTLLLNEQDVLLTFNDTKSICKNYEDFSDLIDYFHSDDKKIIYQNYKNMIKSKSKFANNIERLPSEEQHGETSILYTQSGFLNLVTETTFIVPYNYISEKTLKPIFTYRPFIILGPPGNLKLMQDMGFETFSKWWDESYDDEYDNAKRITKVYEIVKYILNKSYDELNEMYHEMEPTLIHNINQLKNIPNYFLKLSNQYNKTKKLLI